MKLIDRLKPEYKLILKSDDPKKIHNIKTVTEALESYEYVMYLPYGIVEDMFWLFGGHPSPYRFFNER